METVAKYCRRPLTVDFFEIMVEQHFFLFEFVLIAYNQQSFEILCKSISFIVCCVTCSFKSSKFILFFLLFQYSCFEYNFAWVPIT